MSALTQGKEAMYPTRTSLPTRAFPPVWDQQVNPQYMGWYPPFAVGTLPSQIVRNSWESVNGQFCAPTSFNHPASEVFPPPVQCPPEHLPQYDTSIRTTSDSWEPCSQMRLVRNRRPTVTAAPCQSGHGSSLSWSQHAQESPSAFSNATERGLVTSRYTQQPSNNVLHKMKPSQAAKSSLKKIRCKLQKVQTTAGNIKDLGSSNCLPQYHRFPPHPAHQSSAVRCLQTWIPPASSAAPTSISYDQQRSNQARAEMVCNSRLPSPHLWLGANTQVTENTESQASSSSGFIGPAKTFSAAQLGTQTSPAISGYNHVQTPPAISSYNHVQTSSATSNYNHMQTSPANSGYNHTQTSSATSGYNHVQTSPATSGYNHAQTSSATSGYNHVQTSPATSGYYHVQTLSGTSGYNHMQTSSATSGYNCVQTSPATSGYNHVQTSSATTGYNHVQTSPATSGYNHVQTSSAAPGYNHVQTSPATPGYNHVQTSSAAPGYNHVQTSSAAPGYNHVQTSSATPGYNHVQTSSAASGYNHVQILDTSCQDKNACASQGHPVQFAYKDPYLNESSQRPPSISDACNGYNTRPFQSHGSLETHSLCASATGNWGLDCVQEESARSRTTVSRVRGAGSPGRVPNNNSAVQTSCQECTEPEKDVDVMRASYEADRNCDIIQIVPLSYESSSAVLSKDSHAYSSAEFIKIANNSSDYIQAEQVKSESREAIEKITCLEDGAHNRQNVDELDYDHNNLHQSEVDENVLLPSCMPGEELMATSELSKQVACSQVVHVADKVYSVSKIVQSEAKRALLSEIVQSKASTAPLSEIPHSEASKALRPEIALSEANTELLSEIAHSEADTALLSEIPHSETNTELLSEIAHSEADTALLSEIPHSETNTELLSEIAYSEADTALLSEILHSEANTAKLQIKENKKECIHSVFSLDDDSDVIIIDLDDETIDTTDKHTQTSSTAEKAKAPFTEDNEADVIICQSHENYGDNLMTNAEDMMASREDRVENLVTVGDPHCTKFATIIEQVATDSSVEQRDSTLLNILAEPCLSASGENLKETDSLSPASDFGYEKSMDRLCPGKCVMFDAHQSLRTDECDFYLVTSAASSLKPAGKDACQALVDYAGGTKTKVRPSLKSRSSCSKTKVLVQPYSQEKSNHVYRTYTIQTSGASSEQRECLTTKDLETQLKRRHSGVEQTTYSSKLKILSSGQIFRVKRRNKPYQQQCAMLGKDRFARAEEVISVTDPTNDKDCQAQYESSVISSKQDANIDIICANELLMSAPPKSDVHIITPTDPEVLPRNQMNVILSPETEPMAARQSDLTELPKCVHKDKHMCLRQLSQEFSAPQDCFAHRAHRLNSFQDPKTSTEIKQKASTLSHKHVRNPFSMVEVKCSAPFTMNSLSAKSNDHIMCSKCRRLFSSAESCFQHQLTQHMSFIIKSCS